MYTRWAIVYDAHGEKFRFVVAGVWNTAFNYTLFVILLFTLGPLLSELAVANSTFLVWFGERYYLVVQWLAWLLAVPQSTLAFKFFVFRSRSHWIREVKRSFVVALPTQMLSFSLLWLLSDLIGLNPLVGQLITVVIAAVVSYLGHKNYTFRVPQS